MTTVVEHVEDPDAPIKPVETIAFWRRRIFDTIARGGMLHEIIYQESYDIWARIQGVTGGLLRRHVGRGQRVLDAGCGYGALIDCLEEAKLIVNYTGVDISPDLIELAIARYVGNPAKEGLTLHPPVFQVADLRSLPFGNHAFDWAVCRSVEGMIRKNTSDGAWKEMERELLRVARRVLLIGYEGDITSNCQVLGG